MTADSLKHHTALQPLFMIMGLGMAFVGAYILRLATKTTDVNWTKQDQPYEYYRNRRFKFIDPNGNDYSKIEGMPRLEDIK